MQIFRPDVITVELGYINLGLCNTSLIKLYQFVWKVSVLIFYLIIYWTYLKLQVISFKVW
jgi:hypothetical protein